MFMSRERHVGKYHNIWTDNKSFGVANERREFHGGGRGVTEGLGEETGNSDCFSFCMSLCISLYGAMTASSSFTRAYKQVPFRLFGEVVTATSTTNFRTRWKTGPNVSPDLVFTFRNETNCRFACAIIAFDVNIAYSYVHQNVDHKK
jgi:hypothetical protein